MRDDEARIAEILLAAHAFEVALPAFAVGRIGEHEVELAGAEGVVGQGGILRAADDVVRGIAVALQQEVSLADGVGLTVDFLSVEVGRDLLSVRLGDLLEGLFRDGEHAAGAASAVVEQIGTRLDPVGHRQEDQICHEPHGVTRCPVLAGLSIVLLIEHPHQILE